MATAKARSPAVEPDRALRRRSRSRWSAALRSAGVTFRNDVMVGPGGKQVQITDPDGNPIELHEAPA